MLSEKDIEELKDYPLHFYQNGYKWNKEQINKLISVIETDKEIISKMAKRIKAFEDKYLYP